MYIVPIAWLYVALMMAVAEATNSNGSVLGAVITFLLYGLTPVALVVTSWPRRRANARSRRGKRPCSASRNPKAVHLPAHRRQTSQMLAAMRPLPPRLMWSRLCEKNRDGLLTVHQASLPSLP